MNEWFRLELFLVNKHLNNEVLLSKRLTLKQNIDIYLELTNNEPSDYLLVRFKDNQILNSQETLANLKLNEGERIDIYPYHSNYKN